MRGDLGDRIIQPITTVIKPPVGVPMLRVAEIWRSRELLGMFARREVTLRYRQTVLGAAWVVVAPALAAGVFSFVFSSVAKLPSGHVPYFVFALVGMAAWTAFSNGLTRSSQTLVLNAPMVTKIYFERLTLVLGTILATLVDLGVVLIIVAVLLVVFRINPGLAILSLPLWLFELLVLAGALGTIAGALMVRYRDLQPIVLVGTQVLLYISPVAYGTAAIPAKYRNAFDSNPLVGPISGLRWSLLGSARPSALLITYSAGVTLALASGALYVFRTQERSFADVI